MEMSGRELLVDMMGKDASAYIKISEVKRIVQTGVLPPCTEID